MVEHIKLHAPSLFDSAEPAAGPPDLYVKLAHFLMELNPPLTPMETESLVKLIIKFPKRNEGNEPPASP